MTRPLMTVLFALALAILAGVAVMHLHIDTSLASLFSDNDPSARALVRVLDDFRSVEELLILVETAQNDPPQPDRLIDFADRFSHAIAADPVGSKLSAGVSYRVDPQTRQFFEQVLVPRGIFYLDDASFAAARTRLTRPEMVKQIRRDEEMIATPGFASSAMSKVLLKDPLRLREFLMDRIAASRPMHTYQNSDAFLSPDGKALLIRVRGRRPVSDLEFSKHFTASMESLARSANTDQLKLSFAGAYPIAAASATAIRSDMIASVIGSVIALQLLFILAYRKPFRSFVLAFIPVALGTLYGFGAYALLSHNLTPMTAAIGGILAGMAIDYAIAYLSYYYVRRAAGFSVDESAGATSKHVCGAILAAWATSVVGFVAIAFSQTRALRDFALLGALGLTGAFLAAVVVLPALLVLVDRSPSGASSGSRLPVASLLRILSRYPRAILGCALVLFLAAGATLLIPGRILPLESDLTVMHPRPNPPLDAQKRMAEVMGASPDTFVIYLHAASAEGLQQLAHDVDQRLSRAPVRSAGVSGTFGLSSLLPDPSLAKARIDATGPKFADKVIADFRAAVTDSIFDPAAYEPYEQFLRTLLTATDAPSVSDLVRYPSLGDNILPASAFEKGAAPPTEAITLVFLRQGDDTRAARDRAVRAIRSTLSGVDGATLTGLSVLGHDIERSIRRELPRLVLAAVIVAALYLAIHFRDLRDCLLAMLPSIFSLICLLAFMRVSGAKLNMVNLAAFPLLVGIDVDYGIFLVSAIRSKQVHAISRSEFFEKLEPASGAVMMCAASTLLGFGSLAFTSIPAVRSLGQTVAIGVAGCVIGTFCLALPIILLMRRRREGVSA